MKKQIVVALSLALVITLLAPLALTALDLGATAQAGNPEGEYREGQYDSSRWREWTTTSSDGTAVTEGQGQHCSSCPTAYWTRTCTGQGCTSTFTVDGPPPGGW